MFKISQGSVSDIDVQILSNIRNGLVVIELDAKLCTDPTNKSRIDYYFGVLNFLLEPSFQMTVLMQWSKWGGLVSRHTREYQMDLWGFYLSIGSCIVSVTDHQWNRVQVRVNPHNISFA